MSRPDRKFRLTLALSFVALIALVLGIAYAVNARRAADCARLGARSVSIQSGYLCISPDGRVVGP